MLMKRNTWAEWSLRLLPHHTLVETALIYNLPGKGQEAQASFAEREKKNKNRIQLVPLKAGPIGYERITGKGPRDVSGDQV